MLTTLIVLIDQVSNLDEHFDLLLGISRLKKKKKKKKGGQEDKKD